MGGTRDGSDETPPLLLGIAGRVQVRIVKDPGFVEKPAGSLGEVALILVLVSVLESDHWHMGVVAVSEGPFLTLSLSYLRLADS